MAVMPIPVLADNIDSGQTQKDITIAEFSGLNAILGGLGVKNEYLDVQNETGLKTQIQDFLTKSCEGDIVLEEIAYRIAEAESGFQNIPNFLYDGENGKYTAYGIFQITKTTFRNECKENTALRKQIDENIQCGIKLLKERKFYHWNESRDNWYPKLSTKAKMRIQGIYKKMKFLNGYVFINPKGDVIKNGKIWRGGEDIPYI